MIIAAICFLVYELFKMFHAKGVDQAVKNFKASKDVRSHPWLGGMFLIEFVYIGWCIVGLIWFPEWRVILWCILGLSVLKMFLPKTPRMVVIDSAATVVLLLIGVIYMTREYWMLP